MLKYCMEANLYIGLILGFLSASLGMKMGLFYCQWKSINNFVLIW